MRPDQTKMLGAAVMLGGLSEASVAELDRVYPGWRSDLREILQELTVGDDPELRMLAVEALGEFEEWEATR